MPNAPPATKNPRDGEREKRRLAIEKRRQELARQRSQLQMGLLRAQQTRRRVLETVERFVSVDVYCIFLYIERDCEETSTRTR